jgi:hypothetical protein
MRRFFGDDNLIGAFRFVAVSARVAKPRIESVRAHGNRAAVKYLFASAGGAPYARFGNWQRQHDRWRLYHDSYIDQTLQAQVASIAQAEGGWEGPQSPEASRASGRMVERELEYLRSVIRGTS